MKILTGLGNCIGNLIDHVEWCRINDMEEAEAIVQNRLQSTLTNIQVF